MQGTIEPLVLEEHQCEVVADPTLPPPQGTCMFLFLWNHHFSSMQYICLRFFLLSEFDICIALTYVTLCRNLLRQWFLKSTKARLLSTHLFPPARYMYVSLSLVTSFSVHVVYMSHIHYFIWNWHICYFMQVPSEASMHEEHQIGDPPLTSHQVCLCITFFVRLCITFSDLVLEETQIGDPPLPPQLTCIFVDIGI